MNPDTCLQALQESIPSCRFAKLWGRTSVDGFELSVRVQNSRGAGETKSPQGMDVPECMNVVHRRRLIGGVFYVNQTVRLWRSGVLIIMNFLCENTELKFARAQTREPRIKV